MFLVHWTCFVRAFSSYQNVYDYKNHNKKPSCH